MNGICRQFLSLLLLWLGAAVSVPASPLLTLSPAGDLSGIPGSTIGWGFTIANDADYIEINSAQFCVDPVNFPVVCIPPAIGTFTDFISQFNDIIAGPPGGTDSDSISQNFAPIALTGVGSFEIDPGDSNGESDIGQIVLTYTMTTLDPNDPNAKFLNSGVLTANASVTVGTPEPLTSGMLAVAMAAFVFARRILKRTSGY